MPVRSLSSAVLKWPDRPMVVAAAERWAQGVAVARPAVVAVGHFGSTVRGGFGVGSDLDLVVLLAESAVPFERRASGFDVTRLPVPADLLVYTTAEWDALVRRHPPEGPLGDVRWMVDRRGE